MIEFELIDNEETIDIELIDDSETIEFNLTDYNDSEVRSLISNVDNKVDALETYTENQFTTLDSQITTIASQVQSNTTEISQNKADVDTLNDRIDQIPVITKTSQITNDSGFITSYYHDSTKQDVLVSGTNIKTINGNSILGSGNFLIESGAGDYSDLTGKPKINDVELVGNKTSEELGIQPKGDYIVDENYVHTDNNYSDTDKLKVDNITKDYTQLNNLPKINGVELVGDKTNSDLNIPIECLDLSSDTKTLQEIGEGCFIVSKNGKINTASGYSRVIGKGTEIIIVKTNKSGKAILCATFQDGANVYRIDDDASSADDVKPFLKRNDIDTELTQSSTDKKVPSAKITYELTTGLRADLGSNFGEIQEDLYYELVNNKEVGRFDGTVGSKLSKVAGSGFIRFRIPVEENEFYTIKYRNSSTNTKLIHIVDENDIVIQVVDNDIEYTDIAMNEISCLIPKNSKYLCISTYCNSNNFNNHPREYVGLKITKKEVVKKMLDSLYGKTGKFKTLDLSDYSQNASKGGMKPLTDLTEDGVYQVRGKGYINFGNETYDYAPGDIIFRNYDGEAVSFISGTYGAGFFSYDTSEEAYIGGYYTSISDVIYEIERIAKKSMNATNTVLTNQMAMPNYEYRRLSETGSTAIMITLGAALKNLTIKDREEFSLFFKTHATTPCTWTWNSSTVPVKYHGDSVVDGKFVPELNTWYKINARWEGKFWLLNIIGVKGD